MDLRIEILTERVKQFIAQPASREFESLALEVFEFQFHHNLPYRNYCIHRGKTPDSIIRWRDIPAVPTGAFKEMTLTCLPKGNKPEAVFHTSGTTQGGKNQGKHFIANLSIYQSAVLPNFAAHLLPDKAHLRMMILTGSPSFWPHSSLAHMMEFVRDSFGAGGSDYYFEAGGMNLKRILADLKSADRIGEPVFLLGITTAFDMILEKARSEGLKFALAPGSRIMDTGGFKGRRMGIPIEDLYPLYEEVLNIPDAFVVNEYGMTEMGSQFYDNTLENNIRSRREPRYKTLPPWVRTRVVNPETLEDAPPGTVGILQHLDLANVGSVMALLTEDLGYSTGTGFVLTGRVQGAESRGCSLLVEEMKRFA